MHSTAWNSAARRSLVAIACLLAFGCDGEAPPADAGADAAPAPEDAGVDAAPAADAGPPDAGEEDAGPMIDAGPPPPPTPMETGPAVRTELDSAIAMLDAIPMGMRVDGAFVDIDLATVGIDAVIGEKGLGTLSLSDGAVRAFADLRHCRVLLAILDRGIAGVSASTDPATIALHDQLVTLRTTLTRHRDAVARLFVARRDAGIVGAPVLREPFREEQVAFGTGTPARLAFAAEGRTLTTPDASLMINCFGGGIDVTVIDQVSGAELGSVTLTESSGVLDIPLTFDETAILEVTVEGLIRGAMGYSESQCMLTLESRRRLRTAPVIIGEAPLFFDALADFNNAQFMLGDAVTALGSGTAVDATALAAVDAHAGVMSGVVAMLLGSGTTEVPVEARERMRREAVYVQAMTDALIASPQLAPVEAMTVRTALTDLSAAIDALLAALSPAAA